jgi:hypothetical protein
MCELMSAFAQYAQTTAILDCILPWLSHQYLGIGAVNRFFRAAYKAVHPPATCFSFARSSEASLLWAVSCLTKSVDARVLKKFAINAVQHDSVATLQYCCTQAEVLQSWSRQVSHEAAAAGAIGVLTWLHSAGQLWRSSIYAEAISHKNMQLVQWAHAHGCSFFDNTFVLAAGAGDVAIMQLLREQGMEWDYGKTVAAAAVSGNPDACSLLHWLQQQNPAWWSAATLSPLLYSALLTGNTATADWLLAQGVALPQQLWHTNVYVGPVVCSIAGLRWARANGCDWDRCGSWGSACEFVIGAGDSYSVDAVAAGTPWCVVAHSNSRAAVEWAHKEGCCSAECPISARLSEGSYAAAAADADAVQIDASSSSSASSCTAHSHAACKCCTIQ